MLQLPAYTNDRTTVQLIAVICAYKDGNIDEFLNNVGVDTWNRHINEGWLLLDELRRRGIYPGSNTCRYCGQMYDTVIAADSCAANDLIQDRIDSNREPAGEEKE